jgi:hypothetical protein
MTDDDLPAAARPGADDRPELRASDEDRDRAVEIIRVAAGDGRLSAAELDERLDLALTARTTNELAALTADLPEVSAYVGEISPRANDIVRLDYQGGNASRRGRWMVPRRMEIRTVGGVVKLDFTNAVITNPDAADPDGGQGRLAHSGDQARHRGRCRRGGSAWRKGQGAAGTRLDATRQPKDRDNRRDPRRPTGRTATAATFRQWMLRRPGLYASSVRECVATRSTTR